MNVLKKTATAEEIPFVGASLSANLDSWLWDFSAELASKTDLNRLKPVKNLRGDYVEVEFTLGSQTWALIIDKASSRDTGFSYSVSGYSKAAFLGQPFALPITKTWELSSAKTIAQELCDAAGITLDWQVLDWSVKSLIIQKRYPIDIIKELTDDLGVKIQATPAGVLTVIYGFVNPKLLPLMSADVELATDRNIFERGSIFINHDNFNRALITTDSQANNAPRVSIEEEQSGADRLLKVFITPFQPDEPIDIAHSSGANVIVFYEGVKSQASSDTVFLIDGKANLSKSFDGLDTVVWHQDVSGSLSLTPAGAVECSTHQFGLVTVNYQTHYHQYRFQKLADIEMTGVKIADLPVPVSDAGQSITLVVDSGDKVADPVIVKTLSSQQALLIRAQSELFPQVYDAEEFTIDCAYQGSPIIPGMIVQVKINNEALLFNALVKSVSISIGDVISQSVTLERYLI